MREITEVEAVQSVVTEFGSKLKNVPLAAEPEIIRESIKREYAAYVSPLLLERWLNDPLHAPGRLTSSPWPEGIEIKEIRKVGEYYEIVADVVLLTSVDVVQNTESSREPAYITVANIGGTWVIGEYVNSME